MKKKETKTTLQGTIDKIEEKFGEGAIMRLKGMKAVDVGAISTGSIGLDFSIL